MRSLRRCFGNRPPTLNLLRTGISEVGAAAPTPIKVRDNKHTRERIRTKTCKPRKGQITDFGPPEAGKLWAEIGNKSFAATSDGRDDAVEVGVGHGRTGRKAEATVEQVFCHFSPHRSCGIFSLCVSACPVEFPVCLEHSTGARHTRFSRSSLFQHQ